MNALLSVQELSLNFGGTRALDHISLEVREGEILGLIGPNGAGKTSLLNCICGFYRPSEGRIDFRNQRLENKPIAATARLGVARTFQTPHLSPDLTVLQNVLVGCHQHMGYSWWRAALAVASVRRAERAASERAREILAFLGLERYAERGVGQLSFAQQKKVEIGRALAAEPRLLLLDEPDSGMNPQEKDAISGLIRSLRNEHKITPVIVEHDLRMMTNLCDRLVALDFGTVLVQCTPADVLRDHRVVSAYVGESK